MVGALEEELGSSKRSPPNASNRCSTAWCGQARFARLSWQSRLGLADEPTRSLDEATRPSLGRARTCPLATLSRLI